MHCISDSACYTTPHHPLHPHLCMCCPCLFVCLFVCLPLSLAHMLLVCLLVSPSRLFLLMDGQWTSAKSDCIHSIRMSLGRGFRSSLILNSASRREPPHRLGY